MRSKAGNCPRYRGAVPAYDLANDDQSRPGKTRGGVCNAAHIRYDSLLVVASSPCDDCGRSGGIEPERDQPLAQRAELVQRHEENECLGAVHRTELDLPVRRTAAEDAHPCR